MGTNYSESVENKVFKKSDVIRLIKLISSGHQKKSSKDLINPTYTNIELLMHDGNTYTSEEYSSDDIDGVLETKRLKSISLSFRSRETESTVSIKLTDSKYGLNYFSVESNDNSWFRAKKDEIKEWLDSVETQNNIILNHTKIVETILRFWLGYAFLLCIFLTIHLMYGFADIELPPTDKESVNYKFVDTYYIPIMALLSYVAGLLPADFIMEKVKNLWPSIEFNFGPDHLNKIKKNRIKLGYLISALVIPVILIIVEESVF